MLGEDATRLVLALISLTAACGPAASPEVPVAVIAPASAAPSTVVEVSPRRDGAPDAQVAASGDDQAEPDSRAPTAEVAAPAKAPRGPRAATLEALRFPPARRSPRMLALLSTELRGLVALVNSAPRFTPDRPKLMRRIADDYVELEATGIRDGNDKVAADARSEAIKYYAALYKEAPLFCVGASAQPPVSDAGCADEVLYYLGYEYERAAQLMDVRKTYYTLLKSFPTSPYIPDVYLAFGELFFREAASDPSKWPLAEQSYLEVVKYPPPDNDVYGYALLRLGAVNESQGNVKHAHLVYYKLRKEAAAHPDWDIFTVPAGLIPVGAP